MTYATPPLSFLTASFAQLFCRLQLCTWGGHSIFANQIIDQEYLARYFIPIKHSTHSLHYFLIYPLEIIMTLAPFKVTYPRSYLRELLFYVPATPNLTLSNS